jgi:hypothetical protein
MKAIFAAVTTALLSVSPAFATSYSGVGVWSLINPGFSTWSANDPIIWSFTTGAQITPDQLEVTDFYMKVGSEEWTMDDFVTGYSSVPIALLMPTGLEVIYQGVNDSNTALHTGLFPLLGAQPNLRPTTFGVWNFGESFSGGIGGLGRLSAVPEPTSWTMLIAGFGLTGAAMRRRSAPIAA